MRYVAAYLLANLGGNDNPSANDIKKILGSVGISVEDDKLELVLSSLKGKNINQLIEAGKGKLAGIPSGGAGVGAASGGGGSSGAAGGDAGEAAPAEEKKEEKKEDSDSESDDDMGFGLFD